MMMMMMMMTMMTNITPYSRTKTHIWEKVLMGIWASALRVAMINNHVDDYAENDEDNDIDGDDANLLSGGSCSGKRSLTEMTMTVTIMRLIMVIML